MFRAPYVVLYFQKSFSALFQPSLQAFLLFIAAFHHCFWASLWISGIFNKCLKMFRSPYVLLHFQKNYSVSWSFIPVYRPFCYLLQCFTIVSEPWVGAMFHNCLNLFRSTCHISLFSPSSPWISSEFHYHSKNALLWSSFKAQNKFLVRTIFKWVRLFKISKRMCTNVFYSNR